MLQWPQSNTFRCAHLLRQMTYEQPGSSLQSTSEYGFFRLWTTCFCSDMQTSVPGASKIPANQHTCITRLRGLHMIYTRVIYLQTLNRCKLYVCIGVLCVSLTPFFDVYLYTCSKRVQLVSFQYQLEFLRCKRRAWIHVNQTFPLTRVRHACSQFHGITSRILFV